MCKVKIRPKQSNLGIFCNGKKCWQEEFEFSFTKSELIILRMMLHLFNSSRKCLRNKYSYFIQVVWTAYNLLWYIQQWMYWWDVEVCIIFTSLEWHSALGWLPLYEYARLMQRLLNEEGILVELPRFLDCWF